MVDIIFEVIRVTAISLAWFYAGKAVGERHRLGEYLRGYEEGFEVCRDYLRAYHEGELNQVNKLLAKASQRRRGQKDLDHDS